MALQFTPLHEEHAALGAKFSEFCQFDMPMEYSSTRAEHLAVRSQAGLFDVSHMGRFFVAGLDAELFLSLVLTNDVRDLAPGQAQYSLITNERGGTVDDILVYKITDDGTNYLLVVNACNREKDFSHFAKLLNQMQLKLTIKDRSVNTALMALQGPKALEILQPLASFDLSSLKYYWFRQGTVGKLPCLISRTGYTGEDGFELLPYSGHASQIWNLVLKSGHLLGLIPAGLGARDTLRLEAGMALYGHELDEETSPLEAGLDRWVKLNRPEMVGYEALMDQQTNGLRKKLVGFKLIDPGVARQGHLIRRGEVVGIVTSGTRPFTVKESIGMGFVPPELSALGTELDIEIREGRTAKAVVVKKPFYTKPKKEAA